MAFRQVRTPNNLIFRPFEAQKRRFGIFIAPPVNVSFKDFAIIEQIQVKTTNGADPIPLKAANDH